MSRFPSAAPRGARHPRILTDAVHISVIGDVHFQTDGLYNERTSILRQDVNAMLGRRGVSAIVQVGDQTTTSTDTEFTAYKAWRAAFDQTGIQWGQVPGNHELNPAGDGTADVRSPTSWAGAVGQAGMGGSTKDAYLDVGSRVRILLVSPAETQVGQAATRRLTLDPATLAWCDARMSEVPNRQCVIVFHAPLPNTVGPLVPDAYAASSFDERWVAHSDSSYTIAQMIAKHPNFVAWVAGHQHAHIGEYQLVTPVTYGAVTFAHIAASSPAMWFLPTSSKHDPIVSPLVTILPDRIEVRYRSHGRAQWLNPVYTVTL